jgi:hypothetical protein
MTKTRQGRRTKTVRKRWLNIVVLSFIALALCVQPNYAQSIYATLTGVVADPSGAQIPQAKVTLKNEATGDVRRTVSNTEGRRARRQL